MVSTPGEQIRSAAAATREAAKVMELAAAGHELSWGQTPATQKRYAQCSCGWRAPVRAKLTHGMSDIRDHLAVIWRELNEVGNAELKRRVSE